MKIDLSYLKEIEKEKSIPMGMILEALEDALSAAYKKDHGTLDNVKINIDRNTFEMYIIEEKEVVSRVKDPQAQITLSQAKKIKEDAEKGEIIQVRKKPEDLGRIAAQTARQVIFQRIREKERDIVYDELSQKVGQVISVHVHRFEQRNVIMDMGKAEGLLPVTEQVPGEHFRHNERIKCYVIEIKKTPRGPVVILSRAHPQLIVGLFDMEVPEISSGLIEIVNVAREAGHRSKIAVLSNDPSIDAVGACVGPRGSRVQAVVDELRGEKLDIINYNDDPVVFICNALSPAKILKVGLDKEEQLAKVIVQDNMLSLAIGKEGQNARLAAKLTAWKIDIRSESQAQAAKVEEEVKQSELKKQIDDNIKKQEEQWKIKEEEARKLELELEKLKKGYVEKKEPSDTEEKAKIPLETKIRREESPEYLALMELEEYKEEVPEEHEEPEEEWKWEEVLEEVSAITKKEDYFASKEELIEEKEPEAETIIQSIPESVFNAEQLGYAPSLMVEPIFEAESMRGKAKKKSQTLAPDINKELFDKDSDKSRGKKFHKGGKKRKGGSGKNGY